MPTVSGQSAQWIQRTIYTIRLGEYVDAAPGCGGHLWQAVRHPTVVDMVGWMTELSTIIGTSHTQSSSIHSTWTSTPAALKRTRLSTSTSTSRTGFNACRNTCTHIVTSHRIQTVPDIHSVREQVSPSAGHHTPKMGTPHACKLKHQISTSPTEHTPSVRESA